MKSRYLLILLMTVSLFAGSVTSDLIGADRVHKASCTFGRGDTLQYDTGVFDNGLGFYTGTGIIWPDPDSTYGFATHFILSQFGLVNQKIAGIMLYFYNINDAQHNFRLYVWNNKGPGLSPKSEGPHLYSDRNAVLPAIQTWGYFDLSAQNIVLPDTFWIGVCYNHFATIPDSTDWYLAMYTMSNDPHTYLNDMDDGSTGWVPASQWGYNYPYGVRVIAEDASGISERHILIPGGVILKAPAISRDIVNIEFTLDREIMVELSVYDVLGRMCKTLINEKISAGKHTRTFNLNLGYGIYFYYFKTDTGVKLTKKFLFLD